MITPVGMLTGWCRHTQHLSLFLVCSSSFLKVFCCYGLLRYTTCDTIPKALLLFFSFLYCCAFFLVLRRFLNARRSGAQNPEFSYGRSAMNGRLHQALCGAFFHTERTIDTQKRVVIPMTGFGIHSNGIRGANPGAGIAKDTFFDVIGKKAPVRRKGFALFQRIQPRGRLA